MENKNKVWRNLQALYSLILWLKSCLIPLDLPSVW